MIPEERGLVTLLALPSVGVPEPVVAEAASICEIDSHRMGLLLKRKGLTVLARTPGLRAADAVGVLKAAGVRCAAITTEEMQDAPRPMLAGGVTRDAAGRVVLRVHGKSAGPPPGAPLLMIFGDLATAPEGPSVISARRPDTFGQRILRAAFPVVDVVWPEGRIRIALTRMTWTGLPGRGFSGPANLQALLRMLTEQAVGVVLDDGFEAQELPLGPLLVAGESLEGVDRERGVRFERYVVAAVAAWKSRLYPDAGPGQIATLGGGAPAAAAEFFSRRPTAASPIPLPWIRGGGRSRVRSGWFWPFLIGLPFLGAVFDTRAEGAPGFVIAGLVIAGGAGLAHGLRALRRRERLRSLLPSRIRSMALGAVQLSGKVVPCFPLLAPYARVRCGWYRLELRSREEGDSDGGYWIRSSERSGSGDMPFWLEDSTAAVLVVYNGLVAARRECDRAWSNIDVLLKQRHDELPRLVEVCRSHAAFERGTLEAVVTGRARVADARTIAAQTQESSSLSAAVRNLLATAENYPSLKASESFLRLQSRITEIEDQIADRRELYNAAATEWNTRLEQIPDLYLARAAGMRPRPLWRERNR